MTTSIKNLAARESVGKSGTAGFHAGLGAGVDRLADDVQMSRGARFGRELRIRWWPRFILLGLVLAVVGVKLLGGAAQFAVTCLGVAVAAFAVIRPLSRDDDYRREPPVPPAAPYVRSSRPPRW